MGELSQQVPARRVGRRAARIGTRFGVAAAAGLLLAAVACTPPPTDPGDGGTATTTTSTTTSTTSTTSTTTTTTVPLTPLPTTALRFISPPGEYIGGGQTRTWLPTDAVFTASRGGARLTLTVDGGSQASWTLDFGSAIGDQLEEGRTYTGAQRLPFKSPTRPGLNVTGSGRGCNTLEGAFTIRELATDTGGNPTRVAIDFEQRCDNNARLLTGTIHWNASVPSLPIADGDGDGVRDQIDNCVAAANPTQADSDRDGAGDACDSAYDGTFLYFQSDLGDYIGQGLTRTWFPADGTFTPASMYAPTNARIRFNAGSTNWELMFRNANGAALTPGTYTNAQDFSSGSPTRPGIDVYGSGRSCSDANGTFTIHEIEMGADGLVSKLSVDFEQRCGSDAAALRGSLRYRATGPT